MNGHAKQILVVAHEYPGEYGRQQFGDDNHYNAGGQCDFYALTAYVLEFRVVLRAVVVARYRSCTDGVSDVYRRKDELHIHQHSVSGNSVLSGKSEQLEIIQHAHDRR